MRLDVERSGGVAGRTLRWSLDVDALDPAGRAEVRDLLAQAPGWSGSAGPDRFSYRVVARPDDRGPADGGLPGERADGGHPGHPPELDVRFAEPLPDSARRLLAVVTAARA